MRKESTVTVHNNNVSPIMRNESAVTANNNNLSLVTKNESTVTANNNDISSINTTRTEASNVIGFVNSRKAAPAKILNDNLTREELAMYFKYDMDKRDEEIAALNKKHDEMVTSINGLTNTVVKITESLSILSDSLSTLHGNYKIASNANHRLLKNISETIAHSADATEAVSDKIVSFINASMSNINQARNNSVQDTYVPEFTRMKSSNGLSNYYNETPANILAKIEKYRDKHGLKSNKGAAHSIAHKMSKKGHIDMKELRRNKAAEVHYANVCFGYLVNNDPNLKELFDLVVEEH